jgi:hypothetical protein
MAEDLYRWVLETVGTEQLSKAKRQSHFPRLTDQEVQALEDIIRTHLLPGRLEPAPQPTEEEPPPPPKHTYGARPR